MNKEKEVPAGLMTHTSCKLNARNARFTQIMVNTAIPCLPSHAIDDGLNKATRFWCKQSPNTVRNPPEMHGLCDLFDQARES
jgi:hypothetical protein